MHLSHEPILNCGAVRNPLHWLRPLHQKVPVSRSENRQPPQKHDGEHHPPIWIEQLQTAQIADPEAWRSARTYWNQWFCAF